MVKRRPPIEALIPPKRIKRAERRPSGERDGENQSGYSILLRGDDEPLGASSANAGRGSRP